MTEWSYPMLLDPLAAAYAESGDFESAAAWQEKAIGLVPDGVKKDEYRARLAIYRERRPYHGTSLFPKSP